MKTEKQQAIQKIVKAFLRLSVIILIITLIAQEVQTFTLLGVIGAAIYLEYYRFRWKALGKAIDRYGDFVEQENEVIEELERAINDTRKGERDIKLLLETLLKKMEQIKPYK